LGKIFLKSIWNKYSITYEEKYSEWNLKHFESISSTFKILFSYVLNIKPMVLYVGKY